MVAALVHAIELLALIVAIRTFLGVSLDLEISGRWPWQHAASAPAPRRGDAEGPQA